MDSDHAQSGSLAGSLGKRLIALLVLAVAAWIVLKMVIGFVTAIASTVVLIAAVIAIIWAIRTL